MEHGPKDSTSPVHNVWFHLVSACMGRHAAALQHGVQELHTCNDPSQPTTYTGGCGMERTLRVGRRQDNQLVILGHRLSVVYGCNLESHVRAPLVLQHGRHSNVGVQLPQRTSFRYTASTEAEEKVHMTLCALSTSLDSWHARFSSPP